MEPTNGIPLIEIAALFQGPSENRDCADRDTEVGFRGRQGF
jgi:hypothetical protein